MPGENFYLYLMGLESGESGRVYKYLERFIVVWRLNDIHYKQCFSYNLQLLSIIYKSKVLALSLFI